MTDTPTDEIAAKLLNVLYDEDHEKFHQACSRMNIKALLDEREEMKSLLASLGYQTVRDWKVQETEERVFRFPQIKAGEIKSAMKKGRDST